MRIGRRGRAFWGIVVALLLTVSGGEAVSADSRRGRMLSERWCAECHVVSNRQQRASDAVPTFAQIGASKRFSDATLAEFLANPHRSRMPNLALTRSEIEDLSAYIKRQPR